MGFNRFSLRALVIGTFACALLFAVLRTETGRALFGLACLLGWPSVLVTCFIFWHHRRRLFDALYWSGVVGILWLIVVAILFATAVQK